MDYDWIGAGSIPSKNYRCGYCGHDIASDKGYSAEFHFGGHRQYAHIAICHYCKNPTFLDGEGRQFPGAIYGKSVDNLPTDEMKALYDEARKCVGFGAFNAAILTCRKLLMHVAVELGAPENQTFLGYVDYLVDNHFVPSRAKGWVDHIRLKGNEATHQIVLMGIEDASNLVDFIEMILRTNFEYPAIAAPKTKNQLTP
jgi:hypothetical protein